MEPGILLSRSQSPQTEEERTEMIKTPYINAVGALMYLAVGTRPDIMYSVAKLAQYNSNPGPAHWKAVKHLFRYLKGTMDLKLTYTNNPTLSSELFEAYSDADYAGCLDTRKSTSGFLIKMGNGAISWSAKKQVTIANSSTEAEYVSASMAGREVIWMRSLLGELGFKIKGPSPLSVDNQSALKVLRNPEHHSKMKHIDIKMHWIRQEIKRKQIEIHFCPTKEMTADILTKPLNRLDVERHRLAMGLI